VGWLNRPRALFREARFFWVSSEYNVPGAAAYQTLNWFEVRLLLHYNSAAMDGVVYVCIAYEPH
jgi:hypothetical protein